MPKSNKTKKRKTNKKIRSEKKRRLIFTRKRILDYESLRRVLIFLIKFNILAIPLYIVMILGLEIFVLKDITANLVTGLLQTTDIPAVLDNLTITIPITSNAGVFAAYISWDCVGWKSMWAFFALVFATPLALEKKMWALLLIPIIFVINIFRIWFMFFYVHNFGLAYYDLLHAVVWSWGLIFVVLIFWVLWLRWAAK